MRKIIHIDADCFFAAVETRDNPRLKGLPIAVGGAPGRRGVVCTASYEARKFGVHSAMASAHALRLCPSLQIIPPDMARYKEAMRRFWMWGNQPITTVAPLGWPRPFKER